MIGLAMGCIRHWYEGAEYHIDELCISTDMQGKGIGTEFIRQIEGLWKCPITYHLLNHYDRFLIVEQRLNCFMEYRREVKIRHRGREKLKQDKNNIKTKRKEEN